MIGAKLLTVERSIGRFFMRIPAVLFMVVILRS
jgi:hypothetical protein